MLARKFGEFRSARLKVGEDDKSWSRLLLKSWLFAGFQKKKRMQDRQLKLFASTVESKPLVSIMGSTEIF